jgi:hydrogenase maturation protein HypF
MAPGMALTAISGVENSWWQISPASKDAHLRYVPLAGGDVAVREPWRMALSYLRDTYGAHPLPDQLPFLRSVPERSIKIVDTMIARRFQTVETSSCGRLFDAVASLVGIRQQVTFEGQAVIANELLREGA